MREKIPALPSSQEREKLQPVRLTNDARFNFVCWIVAPIHQCRRRFPPQKTGGSCIRSLSLVINDHSFVSQLLSLRREMAESGGNNKPQCGRCEIITHNGKRNQCMRIRLPTNSSNHFQTRIFFN